MALPQPGSQEHEEMIEHMKADADSNKGYTKAELEARKIIRSKGLDFDEEFENHRKL